MMQPSVSRMGRVRRPELGFTLIELMITVAIVGILAAIAYPAYTDSVRKGRRAEARTALLNLMQQQERYLTQNGSYMTFDWAATGNNGTVHPNQTGQSIPFQTKSSTSSNAHRLRAQQCVVGAVTLDRNQCVMLSAEPPAGADPAAGTLTLMSTGAKSCTGTDTGACWK